MATEPVNTTPSPPPKPKGPVAKALGLPFKFLGFLAGSLVLAIVIEWLGMVFFWPEQGAHHSRTMMLREIEFLSADFRSSLFASSPSEFARQFSDLIYHYLIEWTRLDRVIAWLAAPPPPGADLRSTLHAGYGYAEPFVLSAVMTVQTFSLRLAILLLSLPCFALFGAVGLADGLMRRDLRRWGGGRESSVAHHYAKATTLPLLCAPWIIYLSLPITVHPNWVILPCAAAFGASLCVTSATFKKYL